MKWLTWNNILHTVVTGAGAVLALSVSGIVAVPVALIKVAMAVGLIAAKVAPGVGQNAPTPPAATPTKP
jgi:hypothetical protein